jgi:hypothetical protein
LIRPTPARPFHDQVRHVAPAVRLAGENAIRSALAGFRTNAGNPPAASTAPPN